MEAESEVVGFHESVGRQKLDGEVVLSKQHKEAAYNVDMMREKVVEEAVAVAVQPCLIHNHLLIMAD